MRKFHDALRLPPLNRFGRNQFCADSESGRAGQIEARCILLIDASRGNQWHLRQRRVHRLDVPVPADRSAREHLDEVGTGAPCGDYLGRCYAPGRTATPSFAANSTIAGLNDGEVMKLAPASMHKRAVFVSSTDPAPTMTLGSE